MEIKNVNAGDSLGKEYQSIKNSTQLFFKKMELIIQKKIGRDFI